DEICIDVDVHGAVLDAGSTCGPRGVRMATEVSKREEGDQDLRRAASRGPGGELFGPAAAPLPGARRRRPEIRHARAGQGSRRVTTLPRFDLAGQAALITGASSGIGRHLGRLLAAAGAKVALAARRADQLAEAAREIEADGGIAEPLACDVTRAASVSEAVGAARGQCCGLS